MVSERTIKKTGTYLFLLFGASIFVAKAPINSSSALLLITTLITLARYWDKEIFLKNRYVLILLSPLLIGFCLSFFSMAGIKGPVLFLLRYRFLLLVIPFVLFVTKRITLFRLLVLMNIAAFFDVAYCVISSGTDDMFNNLSGYHKLGRNSDMLFTLCLFNTNLLIVRFRDLFNQYPGRSLLLVINTLFLFAGVVMLGERAAWLGMICGLTIFLAVYARKLLVVLVVLTLLSPLYLPQVALDRFNDIYSNNVRLKLYRLGIDFIVAENCYFFGTGAKNAHPHLDEFVKTQPLDYQEDYHHIFEVYPGNLHSSFLQMAVEAGLVFMLAYLAAILWVLGRLLKARKKMNPPDQLIIMSVVSVSIGFLISQIFHEELYRYGGLVFSILLYSACFIEQEYAKQHA